MKPSVVAERLVASRSTLALFALGQSAMRSTTQLMMSFMAVFMWHQCLGLRAQELTSGPDLDRIATISELGKLYGELAALNDVLLY